VLSGVTAHALGSNEEFLIWASDSQGIGRCALSSCAGTRIDGLVAPAVATPVFQIIADQDHAYWVNGPDSTSAKVWRCEIKNCSAEQLTWDLLKPRGIAMDETFVWVAVAGSSPGANDGQIMRITKSGEPAFVSYLNGLKMPSGIAVTETHLYWTSEDFTTSAVWRCAIGPVSCGVPEKLTPPGVLAEPIHDPRAIVADAKNVVWVNETGGSLMTCPVEGCSQAPGALPVLLGAGLTTPGGLVASQGCLFLLDEASGGRILAAPRP
jgi:hypothetical protein